MDKRRTCYATILVGGGRADLSDSTERLRLGMAKGGWMASRLAWRNYQNLWGMSEGRLKWLWVSGQFVLPVEASLHILTGATHAQYPQPHRIAQCNNNIDMSCFVAGIDKVTGVAGVR